MAVYFIRDEHNRVKIGFTRGEDALYRSEQLQIGNADQLTLVRFIPEAEHAIERGFHRHYAARWIRNEWFQFCPTMLTIASPPPLPPPLPPPPRDYMASASASARRAFAAAREANGGNRQDVAARHGVSISTLTRAMAILTYGSPEDEANVLAGRANLARRAFEVRQLTRQAATCGASPAAAA